MLIYLILFVLALVALFEFTLYPRFGFWMFFISIFLPIVQFERLILNSATLLRNLPYFLLSILIVLLVVFGRNKIKNFIVELPLSMRVNIAVLIILAVISNYVNGSSIMSAIFSLRWMFLIFGTIFCSFSLLDERQREKVLKIFLLIGIFQIPITLFQRVVIVNILNIGLGDFVTGLFPKFHHLVFYQIFCILLVLSKQAVGKRISKIPIPFLLFMLIIPLILSNSKAAWLYLLFSLVVFLIISKLNFRAMMKYVFVFSIILVIGTLAFNNFYASNYRYKNMEYLFNFDAILEYNLGGYTSIFSFVESLDDAETGSNFGRLGSVIYNYFLISQRQETLLFGLGSISKLESVTGTFDSSLLLNTQYVLGSTFTRTLGGRGILGLIAIILLLIQFYRWPGGRYHIPRDIVILRKSVIVLIGSLLIYYNVTQSFLTAIVLGIIYIQDRRVVMEEDIQLQEPK